jgi:hypothetical protein
VIDRDSLAIAAALLATLAQNVCRAAARLALTS